MAGEPRYALFHRIAFEADARVRREVVALALKPLVDFRNVNEPENLARLRELGGAGTPALWDGERLHEGDDAVLRAVRAIIPPRGGAG